jgi:hypothetical protein
MDLASLNIQRGRDHGLADYNTTRAAYGLPRVTSFAQITSDTALQTELQSLYGTVNNIDLWVGVLAENHLPGGSLGPLGTRILVDQFTRLRDGDRFWYERQFTGDQFKAVRNTHLSDVIRRNTGLTNLQANAFYYGRPDPAPLPTSPLWQPRLQPRFGLSPISPRTQSRNTTPLPPPPPPAVRGTTSSTTVVPPPTPTQLPSPPPPTSGTLSPPPSPPEGSQQLPPPPPPPSRTLAALLTLTSPTHMRLGRV